MDTNSLLDWLPLWGLFLATVALVVLSIEAGYRLGRYRRARSDEEKDAPVGAIVASTLGLLAFILTFTFGLAATRFDARRMVVVEESNAIGTTYLRAGLLPEPQRAKIRQLLKEYVDTRLAAIRPDATQAAVTRSTDLHRDLWAQATQVAALDNRSVITSVFIQALNEVIDLHAKRVMLGMHNRIPVLVWLVLYFMTIISMTALGYQEGLSGSRRSIAVIALAMSFSGVMLLIADLDRPQEGFLRVGQRAMLDLQESLKSADIPLPEANP